MPLLSSIVGRMFLAFGVVALVSLFSSHSHAQHGSLTIHGEKQFCVGESTEIWVDDIYDSYLWSSGDTTASLMVSTAGWYCVTATSGTNEFTGCDGVVEIPLKIMTLSLSYCSNEDPWWIDTVLINDTITGAIGCDTVVHITITEDPLVPNAINMSKCSGDTAWVDGVPYIHPGIYIDTVASVGDGCDTVLIITIDQFHSPDLEPDVIEPDDGTSNGFIELPYDPDVIVYEWSNGQQGHIASMLGAGTYSVTATDIYGCAHTASYVVPVFLPFDNDLDPTKVITAQTDPNGGNVNLSIPSDLNIREVVGYDSRGRRAFQFPLAPNQKFMRIYNLKPGIYLVAARGEDGTDVSKPIKMWVDKNR